MQTRGIEADVGFREINRSFTYDQTVMLTLQAAYPVIALPPCSRGAQARINGRFRAQALRFYRRAAGALYMDAIREYRDSVVRGYPFRAYDAALRCGITLNEGCFLSVYCDRYEFTGGAHGSTVRTSGTFDLRTGRELALPELFARGQDCRGILLERILRQADGNMEKDPVYFEDYRALIAKNFKPESFYLTPAGIVIYYQQYEIAPYSAGIVAFEVPYAEAGAEKPDCRKA